MWHIWGYLFVEYVKLEQISIPYGLHLIKVLENIKKKIFEIISVKIPKY